MGKQVFRMSSSGYCSKRLSAMVLDMAGTAPPPWLAKSAEEGNWHEGRIKQELRDLGCIVIDDQRELELNYNEFNLVGHIDGLIKLSGAVLDASWFDITFVDIKRSDIDFSKVMLLEVKSFGFNEYQRWLAGGFDAFPWYASQSTCYERALAADMMAYAVKDRSGGARRLYIFRGERASMPEIIDKLQTVVAYTSKGQLAPADFNLDSIECRRFCSFRDALCSPSKAFIDNSGVEAAAHDYLVGRRMVTQGTVMSEEAKVTIAQYANDKNLNRWQVGPYDISYSTYPRESISIKGLLEIMERNQFDAAVKVSEIERVRVVDVNEDS